MCQRLTSVQGIISEINKAISFRSQRDRQQADTSPVLEGSATKRNGAGEVVACCDKEARDGLADRGALEQRS